MQRSSRRRGRASFGLGGDPPRRQRVRLRDGHGAVIVAVPVVRVVKVPADDVVGVIAVGDGVVPAARAVLVRGVVALAVV